jgi:hypothetical protein
MSDADIDHCVMEVELMETCEVRPEELWLLWHGDGWCGSIDDAPGGQTYLASTSMDDAVNAAVYQTLQYDVTCIPIRVIPPTDDPEERAAQFRVMRALVSERVRISERSKP